MRSVPFCRSGDRDTGRLRLRQQVVHSKPNLSDDVGGSMLSMEIPKETDFSLAISFIGTHYVLLPL